MSINSILPNGSDETRNMHPKSNNIEIMMGSEIDEISDERFESLLQKCQEGLEESMGRGSSFAFDSVDLLYYHLQKRSLKRIRSSYWSIWLERNTFSIAQRRLEKFESNNKSIALNILFVPYNTKQIVHAYPQKT